MSDNPTDRDLDAGEYVLGVLSDVEARGIAARAAADPELAAAIAAWQARLAPLAAAVEAVSAPPDLWRRIAAGTVLTTVAENPDQRPRAAAPEARMRRQIGLWRAVSAGCLALAAMFAGIAYFGHQPTARGVAVLAAAGSPAPAFLAEAVSGAIDIRPLASAAVPTDRDLELWSLPAGATRPVSLGLLPAAGRRIALADLPAERTQLLVSLEPRGGSPTGLPTGPVLYAGTWTRIE